MFAWWYSSSNPRGRSCRPTPLTKSLRDAGIALVVAAAIYVLHGVLGFPTLHDAAGDNDSLLRLVEVHDLIGGQGWFDLPLFLWALYATGIIQKLGLYFLPEYALWHRAAHCLDFAGRDMRVFARWAAPGAPLWLPGVLSALP